MLLAQAEMDTEGSSRLLASWVIILYSRSRASKLFESCDGDVGRKGDSKENVQDVRKQGLTRAGGRQGDVGYSLVACRYILGLVGWVVVKN